MLGQPESHHVLQHSQVLGHTLVTASGHGARTQELGRLDEERPVRNARVTRIELMSRDQLHDEADDAVTHLGRKAHALHGGLQLCELRGAQRALSLITTSMSALLSRCGFGCKAVDDARGILPSTQAKQPVTSQLEGKAVERRWICEVSTPRSQLVGMMA
jgi:hypothetical protein